MDWCYLIVIIWAGCFLVVAIDSAFMKISPVFSRLVALFGSPFALLAYCLVQEQCIKKKIA